MLTSRLQLLLILLALGLVLMRESSHGSGAALQEKFVDWLVSNSRRQMPTSPLVLVEIDDSSMAEGHRWPWSPLDFTLFLQATQPFNPDVVAIEHVLLWDGGETTGESHAKQTQYERFLQDFLRKPSQVLLGAQLGFPEDPDVVPPLQPVPGLRKVAGSLGAVPEFTVIERQPKEEFRLTPKLAFTNLPAGEVPVRTVPLLFRYRGEIVPSFVLRAIMLWHGVLPEEVHARLGSHVDVAGKARIPIDASGAMRVYLKAPYVRLGFDDLLLAAQQREAKREPVDPRAAQLDGAIALLARTDVESRTLPLPGGIRRSSGQLFAAAIATIQSRTYLQSLPFWGEVLVLAVLLGAVSCLVGMPRSRVLGISAALITVYLMLCIGIFGLTLLALPLAMPVGVLLFGALFCMLTPRKA